VPDPGERSPDAPPHVLAVAIRHDGGKNDFIASIDTLIVPENSNTQDLDLLHKGRIAGKIKIDFWTCFRT